MSDLFGSTATPSWLQPEQRDSMLEKQGLEIAQSFNSAFQNAYNSKQQEEQTKLKASLEQESANSKYTTFQLQQAQEEAKFQQEDSETAKKYGKDWHDHIDEFHSSKWRDEGIKFKQLDEQQKYRTQQQEYLNRYRDEQIELKKQQNLINSQVEKSRIQKLHATQAIIAQLPDDVQHQIMGENDEEAGIKNGYRVDDQGNIVGPSDRTLSIIAPFANKSGLMVPGQTSRDVDPRWLKDQTEQGLDYRAWQREVGKANDREIVEQGKNDRQSLGIAGRIELETMKEDNLAAIKGLDRESREKIAGMGKEAKVADTILKSNNKRIESIMGTMVMQMDESKLSPALVKVKRQNEITIKALYKQNRELESSIGNLNDKANSIIDKTEAGKSIGSGEHIPGKRVDPNQPTEAMPGPVATYDPKSKKFYPVEPKKESTANPSVPKTGDTSLAKPPSSTPTQTEVPQHVEDYRSQLKGTTGVTKGAKDMLKQSLGGASGQELLAMAKAMGEDIRISIGLDGRHQLQAPGKDGQWKEIKRWEAEKMLFDAVMEKGLPEIKTVGEP